MNRKIEIQEIYSSGLAMLVTAGALGKQIGNRMRNQSVGLGK